MDFIMYLLSALVSGSPTGFHLANKQTWQTVGSWSFSLNLPCSSSKASHRNLGSGRFSHLSPLLQAKRYRLQFEHSPVGCSRSVKVVSKFGLQYFSTSFASFSVTLFFFGVLMPQQTQTLSLESSCESGGGILQWPWAVCHCQNTAGKSANVCKCERYHDTAWCSLISICSCCSLTETLISWWVLTERLIMADRLSQHTNTHTQRQSQHQQIKTSQELRNCPNWSNPKTPQILKLLKCQI